MPDGIKVTASDEIAVVLFDRPKAFNAFDLDTIRAFARQVTELAVDRKVRGLVLSGEGKVFCAGGDLKWVKSWPEGYAAAFYHLAATYHQAILEVRRMKKPVVAAINGMAAGGGFSLALACDFRVMAESAVLRQAYTSNGLSIDGGGTFTLARLVGLARAMEIAGFDRPIDATQAQEWGLVTKVARDDRVVEEAVELAREIARGSMASFGSSKRLLNDSFNNSMETQLELERAALYACASHGDGIEGINAFFEKRKPDFF